MNYKYSFTKMSWYPIIVDVKVTYSKKNRRKNIIEKNEALTFVRYVIKSFFLPLVGVDRNFISI